MNAAAVDSVLEARGSRYGDFRGHAEVTQGIKRVMRSGVSWQRLSDQQKEAMDMVAHKIGRIVNGDPNYKDSWVDIEGYVRLVSRTLKDE